MSTSQQSLLTVTVASRALGTFDSRSGGEVTAEPTKRRSGGMGPFKSYGALPDYGDVTVSRVVERERDDHELVRYLRGQAGKAPMIVSEQPLDADGVAYGRPTVYTGRLTQVTPGDYDSESNDVRMFELAMLVTSVA